LNKEFVGTGGVVFAGAAHVDRTGWFARASTMGCSNPGQFDERAGGAALNIASDVAALGGHPTLLSHMGDDAAANWLNALAETRGIELHAYRDPGNPTATYTALIEPDGSLLTALADMSVYDGFDFDHFEDVTDTLSAGDWFCVDANIPETQISAVLSKVPAKKVGFTVSKAKAPRLKSSLSELDILFTNRVELGALSGQDNEQDTDIDAAMDWISREGPDHVVVSNGSKAVTVLAEGKRHHVPVSALTQVRDVTGAGDALAAGTLFKLIAGVSFIDAVEFGIRAAQKTIETQGPYRPTLASDLA